MAYCLLAAIIPISQFCIAYTFAFVLDSFYHRSLGGSHLGQMTQATLIARGTSWRPDHLRSLLLNVISSQNAQTICYTFTGPKLMTLSFLPLFWHPHEEISPDKEWSGESIHAVCATVSRLSQQMMPLQSPSLMAVSVTFSAGTCPDSFYLMGHSMFSCMVTWCLSLCSCTDAHTSCFLFIPAPSSSLCFFFSFLSPLSFFFFISVFAISSKDPSGA